MSESERKKKMISLRLSDTEYAILKAQFRTHGARNVSDLARLALQQMMHTPSPPSDNFAGRLSDLEQRVRALEFELAVLAEHNSVTA